MTEVSLNETIDGYRGAIGNLVFKKYKGRIIVCRKPKFTKPPSRLQIAERAHFSEAVAYAQSVKADPVARAFYEPIAKERDTCVYWLAIKDFRCAPSLLPLDLSEYEGKVGDKITIRAVDIIGLAHVDVKVFAQDGTPIEQGKAVENGVRSGKWIYTATAPVALGTDVFIEVNGVDHAGNEAQLSENPTVGMND
jgi:hypothetical protein